LLLTSAALVSAQDQSAGERYAKILADTQSLTRYNEQLTNQLTSQQAQAARMEQQLAEMDSTGAQIPTLIQKMFDSLEQFMAADLPFLDPTQAGPDSRQERLARLRDLMAESSAPDTAADPVAPADGAANKDQSTVDAAEGAADADQSTGDGSENTVDAERSEFLAKQQAKNAERFRRLLEAYQIELEYGRTLFAYTGKLQDGREADFVRVGRVALMYRTSDGEEAGYWDAGQKQWIVANEYNKAIENTVLMATKELAPELMMIPVPAPQEVPL